jgi:hypothetical protein
MPSKSADFSITRCCFPNLHFQTTLAANARNKSTKASTKNASQGKSQIFATQKMTFFFCFGYIFSLLSVHSVLGVKSIKRAID